MTDESIFSTFTPGDLGRAALHDDPDETAEALVQWGPLERGAIAEWFRAVADALDRR